MKEITAFHSMEVILQHYINCDGHIVLKGSCEDDNEWQFGKD
jgi:hypothetical protein